MKQVWITRTGPPNTLQLKEAPDPRPSKGCVRVRVKASGINFADIMARLGLYPDAPKLPAVVGYEISGVIDQVGDGVTQYKEGDRVIGICRFGGYSDTVILPESQLFPHPDNMDFVQSAAIPVNYLTAYQSLIAMGGLRKGDTILIHSAGGGVGLAAIDLAKHVGANIIGTASASKHPALKERGVEHTIDYRTEDFESRVREITDDKGVQLILDAVGGDSWAKGLRILAPAGKLVVFGFSTAASGKTRSLISSLKGIASVPWLKFNPISLMNENRGVLGVNLGHLWNEVALIRQWGTELLELYEQGKIHPTVAKTFPFEEAAAAHSYIQERKNFGKVLLVPN